MEQISSQHIRNNESFSRSRSSTGPLHDSTTALTSTGDTWPSGIDAESSTHDAIADFNAAFEPKPTSSQSRADGEDDAIFPPTENAIMQSHVQDTHQDLDLPNRLSKPKSPPDPITPRDPFASVPEDDVDPWAQALRQNDSSTQPAISDIGDTKTMASQLDPGPPAESIQELQEPLMEAHTADPVPAPAENDDFDEALRSVSGDLQQSQEEQDEKDNTWAQPSLVGHEDDWLKGSEEPKQELDDSWAKAMGGSDSQKDENSWEAALGGDFDEDGFLDDDDDEFLPDDLSSPQKPSTQPNGQKMNAYTPNSAYSDVPQPSSAVANPFAQNSTTAAFTPEPSITTERPNKGQSLAMKFFEDLPDTQSSRSRRARPQIVQPPGTTPSPPLAPPQIPPQPVPPARHSSVPPQPSYSQLQPPHKLDLFPLQPTQSPDGQAYTQQAAPQPSTLQPQPQPPSRYSPAPGASASPASRYSSAPVPGSTPPTTRYSPAPTPQTVQKDPPSYFPPQPAPPQTAQRPPPAPPRQASARYSPAVPQYGAPSQLNSTSPSSASYSPIENTNAPPPGPPPPSLSSHRFAPRTSSPLAQPNARPQIDRSATAPGLPPQPAPSDVASPPGLSNIKEGAPPPGIPKPPPKFEPPARPRTQSPERQTNKIPSLGLNVDRRTSLQDTITSTTQKEGARATSLGAQPQVQSRIRGPSISDDVDFAPPDDAQQVADPLQRWKGSPSLHWSSGSLMVSHFPKRDLRFGGGRSAPVCRSTPGSLTISKTKEQMPIDESFNSFPGPLKSKAKKKELLVWLSNRIDALQKETAAIGMSSMDPRINERLLLWKILRIFVEHDGVLFGNPTVDLAIKQVLIPPTDAPVSGHHSRSASSVTALGQADSSNPLAVAEIQRLLVEGDREKAVWHAVDNRLWGHAMLVASTSEGTLWKQVAHEFIRSEVRSTNSDRKSMAALYSIMTQNWDESVDELVPLSARAGFQMMSTADAAKPNQNALEGLNKWQETLSLVVGNRSPQDEYGLVALGKLLRDYGRIEAAHICFLFAPSVVRTGGLDDPEAHVTLFGADINNDTGTDLDAILLTEIYEFALSLKPSAATQFIPHLQSYKLHHAQTLADAGLRSEASAYCDAIGSAIKSMTRPSAYYHPALIARLEDLNQRLSQTPKDSSSWISKPSVGKVSGSMWAKFNSFVAGDDDAASNGSGPQSENEAGPFARMPGGTPTISRNASQADLSAFTSMNTNAVPAPGNSRYAPSFGSPIDTTPKQPLSSSYQPSTYQPTIPNSAPRDIPRSSQQLSSPPSQSDPFGQPAPPSSYNPYQPAHHHLGISDVASQASSSYDPPILQHPGLANDQPFGSPSTTFSDRGTSSHGLPHEDMPSIEEETAPPQENGYSPSYNGFEATGGYAPPTSDTGYVPYEPEPDSPVEVKSKKKGYMNDNDDISTRASALKDNPMKGREPDPAMVKAAEADAERDRQAKEQRKSSGWLSGWWGKKDPNAPVAHKAKLGEENSFYFDPQLQRWVNKKAPESSQPAASTPPPPKAKPSPPTSMPLPAAGLAPPSRSATPARSDASGSGGEGQGAMPPSMGPESGPPSNPPSRPATSMSNASSAYDELVVPGPRRGAAKKGKKRQLVDPMSK